MGEQQGPKLSEIVAVFAMLGTAAVGLAGAVARAAVEKLLGRR